MNKRRDTAQEARELLAIEHEKIGFHGQATDIRNGVGKPTLWTIALAAIEAAIAAEQERCACVSENHAASAHIVSLDYDRACHDIAVAIRGLDSSGETR